MLGIAVLIRLGGKMRDIVARGFGALRRLAIRMGTALEAGPGVRRGVELAAWSVLVLQVVVIGAALRVGLGPGLDQLTGAALFAGLAALGWVAMAVIVRLLRLIVTPVSRSAFTVLAANLVALVCVNLLGLVPLLPIVIGILVLGGAIGAMVDGGFRSASVGKRVVMSSVALAAVAGLVTVTVAFMGPGSDEHLTEIQPDPVEVAPLDIGNPAARGDHAVRTLTYGSGTDRRRNAYGAGADLVTDAVDGSAFLEGSTGWRMTVREWYWGFDEEHLPLNGHVWYPEGDGPFPLVLVVHGNHSMEEDSTPGYAWLGELLASRGFITVSVDENFLNGSWRGDPERENDARGWMLLEHLAQWRRWNNDPKSPFFGRVDLDRIGLIGHSRGGEAAAIAACFNRLQRYPDDGNVELPSGHGIRAVIAIAPSDGQYEPSGRPTPMDGVSYLVLQGGHDADVSIFMGDRQWHRANLGADNFKASVWAWRANHGQFNTGWGDNDYPWPLSLLVNRAPLLSGEDQRCIGGVFISGFLEAVLHQREPYRQLFRDHRTALEWLPEDVYVTRYQDSSVQVVADFEEDVDPATTHRLGARLQGNDLAVWREEQLSMRSDFMTKENGVAVIGWRWLPAEDGAEPLAARPSYELVLAGGVAADLGLDPDGRLVVALADSGEEPPEEDDEDDKDHENDDSNDHNGSDDDASGDDQPTSLDLSLELVDSAGRRAILPLSHFRQLVPPVRSRLTKLPDESFLFGSAWEITLQTFELPLASFIDAEPELDVSRLSRARLVFDRSPVGMIVVDDIGFITGTATMAAAGATASEAPQGSSYLP